MDWHVGTGYSRFSFFRGITRYAGDGVVSRAKGYGMAGIRVDGNDVFAVNAVVREAKKYALEHNAPVLIEA